MGLSFASLEEATLRRRQIVEYVFLPKPIQSMGLVEAIRTSRRRV